MQSYFLHCFSIFIPYMPIEKTSRTKEKRAKMNWTREQQRAIDEREKNILVAAAAGSGKTAVLVERIIKMLTDKEDPTDVDRLLIVTFTEAAVLAKQAQPKEMWLTHYSPSLVRPEDYMEDVRRIFPRAYPGKDGKSVTLDFEEE